ncbi:MAG: class I SAM-dependent methyltransferase [Patescibacteria group bacterium]
MIRATNLLSKYYGETGGYLREHDTFLRSADIKKDLLFLIRALDIKKSDVILDIACGQGRHSNALAEKGYQVDGVDFSQYLLDKARAGEKELSRGRPNYYKANVEQLNLKKKYSKAYWFFSDLADIDLPKAIVSISHNMKVGGMVLLDTDNIFRILAYLSKNHDSGFDFDASRLELIVKKNNLRIKYPVLPLWEQWLRASGFFIKDFWGDYKFSKYSVKSPRLIILAKKIA